MSRRCQVTGRGPQVGHRVSHAHNLSKRRFNVNLQRVRVLVDGQVRHMRVSTKALKSGLITRPPIKLKERKPSVLEAQPVEAVAATEVAEEEPVSRFFSEATVVHKLFKPKPTPEEEKQKDTTSAEPVDDPSRSSPASNDISAGKSETEVKDSSTTKEEPEPSEENPDKQIPENEAE